MGLNKVKPGSNMYQWVIHTHNHLAGACPHQCSYCSVQSMARRFPVMAERYSGPPRMIEAALEVNYGTEKTIFVENCSDLFAEGIPSEYIIKIMKHMNKYPDNTYVIQTKNPGRVHLWLSEGYFPPHFMIGITAESNRYNPLLGYAPPVELRLYEMRRLEVPRENLFITCEPILKFDFDLFFSMLLQADAGTYYIGADSKNHGLPEPTGPEIAGLVERLREAGKKVILKSNLKRLYQGD